MENKTKIQTKLWNYIFINLNTIERVGITCVHPAAMYTFPMDFAKIFNYPRFGRKIRSELILTF